MNGKSAALPCTCPSFIYNFPFGTVARHLLWQIKLGDLSNVLMLGLALMLTD